MFDQFFLIGFLFQHLALFFLPQYLEKLLLLTLLLCHFLQLNATLTLQVRPLSFLDLLLEKFISLPLVSLNLTINLINLLLYDVLLRVLPLELRRRVETSVHGLLDGGLIVLMIRQHGHSM